MINIKSCTSTKTRRKRSAKQFALRRYENVSVNFKINYRLS